MKHSEHLLQAQNELVASRIAFGAYLAIVIDVEHHLPEFRTIPGPIAPICSFE
jgi:hypothetical protein